MADPFVAGCRRAGRLLHASDSRLATMGKRRQRNDSPLRLALEFTGLAVLPNEVRAFALVVSLVVALPAGLIVAIAARAPDGSALPWALPLLAGPLLVAVFILGYPDAVARKVRSRAIAEGPALATYLTMSLRVRPSLESAIAFAAEHGAGPLAARLRRALWDVHMRTRGSIEDALTRIGDEWGESNPELKRACYGIAQAVRDGSRDGLSRSLDRARDLVFEGTRRRWREYAAGLRGPMTALFALGVLLPLIVGSMLPLLSLGTFSPTSIGVDEPPPGNPVPWLLLLDVAFPAITFLFAHHVASRRPAPDDRRGVPANRSRLLLAFGAAPFMIVAGVLLPDDTRLLGMVGVLLVGVSFALFMTTEKPRSRSKTIEAVEAEFPDALSQLGSRLGEGRGLEASFLPMPDGFRRTAMGTGFEKIARSLRLGGTAGQALFGPRGALEGVPSAAVRASLRMVVDLAAKDPETAGLAIVEMASHLRDLQTLERDLRVELRPTVDAMKATATFFAPVVLGVTGALYGLLSRAFSTIASLPMKPPTFHLALGVFLALTTVAIQQCATRIEVGRDFVAFGSSLARALPVGYAIFVATLLGAGSAF